MNTPFVPTWIVAGLLACLLCPACGQNETQIAVTLVRYQALGSREDPAPEGVLDRTMVGRLEIEVLRMNGTTPQVVASAWADVDQTAEPASEWLALKGIEAGSGYLMRARAYKRDVPVTEPGAVFQCAVTGPFDVVAGDKHFISLALISPPADDPNCVGICLGLLDCAVNKVCGSPCACQDFVPGNPRADCTPALCLEPQIGSPCVSLDQCAASATLCITAAEEEGYLCGSCSHTCAIHEDCPGFAGGESACAPAAIARTQQDVCLARCYLPLGRCRSGFACVRAGETGSGPDLEEVWACVPTP